MALVNGMKLIQTSGTRLFLIPPKKDTYVHGVFSTLTFLANVAFSANLATLAG